MISWKVLTFSQLNTHQLFELMKLRVDVFVVEQTCPYPELDEKDRHLDTRHLLGFTNDKLVAYARLIPAGVSYPGVSIGRVATHADFRGNGAGISLLTEAIKQCENLWPNEDIEIGAQEYLLAFYRKFGFVQTSDMYLEDDIPHVDMKRKAVV
ncbi:GNAT family N-acetyltransferase [Alteromonas stellipolaris]|jgi:ElaA protein|uniref:GNAT family N-acetyltransferase n=1 Tax=Alteromonas stellipolaris TaxID=233316 RepID=UPI002118005F|nr:GNAT family N-acetyltransferase [Alteromonas stellipolaris]MCQ8847134.1 GNAT family N-acetyltransferase [Alteromonas stellipolaris]